MDEVRQPSETGKSNPKIQIQSTSNSDDRWAFIIILLVGLLIGGCYLAGFRQTGADIIVGVMALSVISSIIGTVRWLFTIGVEESDTKQRLEPPDRF